MTVFVKAITSAVNGVTVTVIIFCQYIVPLVPVTVPSAVSDFSYCY